MPTATGCSLVTVTIQDRRYKRCIESISDDTKEERCHDCGRLNDGAHYHHLGCDMEKCPVCGGQLMSCNCVNPIEEVDLT
jgi:rRNA maturation protein Nop10